MLETRPQSPAEPESELTPGDVLLADLLAVRAIYDQSTVAAIKRSLKKSVRKELGLKARAKLAGVPFNPAELSAQDRYILDNADQILSEIELLKKQEQQQYEQKTAEVLATYSPADGPAAAIKATPYEPNWYTISPFGELRRYTPLPSLQGNLTFINPGGQVVIKDAEGKEWFVKVFDRDGNPQVNFEVEHQNPSQ